MSRLMHIFAVLCGSLFSFVQADEQIAELLDVRTTIQRSLPFITRDGQAWMDDKDCVSCHQIPFMVWALNSASSKGFDIDGDKLESWNSWATTWQKMANPKVRGDAKKSATLAKANDAIAQLLLGVPGDKATAGWRETYAGSLGGSQQENGSWNPGGQLPSQKRPKQETRDVSTMWSLVALPQTRISSGMDETMKAGLKFLEDNSTKAESSEWWAMRLWLSSLTNNAKAAATSLNHLREHQSEDGGWGWLLSEPSDALGTSMVIYAMTQCGVDPSDPSLQRAIRFLVTTQNDDGTWDVNGTKAGSRDSLTETSVYWGTCWAVIALSEILPAP